MAAETQISNGVVIIMTAISTTAFWGLVAIIFWGLKKWQGEDGYDYIRLTNIGGAIRVAIKKRIFAKPRRYDDGPKDIFKTWDLGGFFGSFFGTSGEEMELKENEFQTIEGVEDEDTVVIDGIGCFKDNNLIENNKLKFQIGKIEAKYQDTLTELRTLKKAFNEKIESRIEQVTGIYGRINPYVKQDKKGSGHK